MRFLVEATIRSIHGYNDPERSEGGLMTGFWDLDAMTNGFRGGELIVLAAPPGIGKTAFVTNIVENLAMREEDPLACAWFSLGMTSDYLVQRLLSSRARVMMSILRGGFLTKEMLARVTESAKLLEEAPIWIDDTPGLSVEDLRVKALKLRRRLDIRLIVIDHLQLLEDADVGGHDGRGHHIRSISRSIKALAKEIGIPIMVLVQLDPGPFTEGEEPGLADLRKTGFLERDADLVAFLVRKECYANEEVPEQFEGEAKLVLAKQLNGPTGVVPLTFQKEFLRFESL